MIFIEGARKVGKTTLAKNLNLYLSLVVFLSLIFQPLQDGLSQSMLIEAKTSSNQGLNPNLKYFQELLNCPFAFQVAPNMQYKEIDCFSYNYPLIGPAKTFYSN